MTQHPQYTMIQVETRQICYSELVIQISTEEFENIINKAIKSLPDRYVQNLQNVAFIVEQQPTEQQRHALNLRGDQTLFGLYEGVPLSRRQGTTKLLPDKITLFQGPLEAASNSLEQLRNSIGRTVWHEVAHYYGLDHQKIRSLEQREDH
jgi:predicted Zn-dependent protease with MMP-like domain